MPGIVGLITKLSRKWAEEKVSRMVGAIRHESFYETGTWSDESLGVYAGWAARKNSFADGMPVCNERRDVSLIFSGEEHPEQGTISRLQERGHLFDPEGPPYLVHLYEEDPVFPAGLNGMFHGLVTDRRRGTAMLFNDRFGMHRLYFYESKDAFYFAGEAKAILAVCSEARTVDPKSLGEFVACSCVLENRTLFKGIHALPAGSAWVFRDSSLEQKHMYFQPREWEDQEALDPETYYQEIQRVFSKALPLYFAGKERVAMTLTGGLDTRTIMAWHESPPGSLPCYTFGGMFGDCQDVRVARRIASMCQQSHEVIRVGEEFLSRFPHYAERSVYLTEGGVDVYRSSDLYVSERARQIAPAKVVGTYGSEILRQAVMFKPAVPRSGLFRSEFLPYVDQARETYSKIRRENPVTFAAFRQSPWYHYGVLQLEQSQLSVRSPYLGNDFVRTVFRAPKASETNDKLRLRLISAGSSALGRIPTDRGIGGSQGRLLGGVSRGFLEFTFKAEYAYDYGMPQWLARLDQLCAPLRFERLFLGRHKLSHFRVWYRGELSKYVREILLDQKTLSRPYLERKGVEAVVQGHLGGGRNYTTEIHKLLTLELLHRHFMDPR